MTSTQERVRSCHELYAGMAIEARANDEMPFLGTVGDIMPKFGLFWAISPSGVRRIIELDQYKVYVL